jgi:hypothetical protein
MVYVRGTWLLIKFLIGYWTLVRANQLVTKCVAVGWCCHVKMTSWLLCHIFLFTEKYRATKICCGFIVNSNTWLNKYVMGSLWTITYTMDSWPIWFTICTRCDNVYFWCTLRSYNYRFLYSLIAFRSNHTIHNFKYPSRMISLLAAQAKFEQSIIHGFVTTENWQQRKDSPELSLLPLMAGSETDAGGEQCRSLPCLGLGLGLGNGILLWAKAPWPPALPTNAPPLWLSVASLSCSHVESKFSSHLKVRRYSRAWERMSSVSLSSMSPERSRRREAWHVRRPNQWHSCVISWKEASATSHP